MTLFLKSLYVQTLIKLVRDQKVPDLRDTKVLTSTEANFLNNFHTNETLMSSEGLFAASLSLRQRNHSPAPSPDPLCDQDTELGPRA